MADKAFIYGLIGGAIGSYLTRPKQQQPIQQQVQQQIARMPHEYDYVIDIYTDKIEITDTNGSKTTLNSIDDLNNWLSSVTGKNILIWNNGDMEGTLSLTSNTYVINGKPTRFEILLTQPNTYIYHLAPNLTENGIFNYSRDFICDIDNSNIFAIDTNVNINCFREKRIQNINITAINSQVLTVSGINGRISAITGYAGISDSELTDGLMLIAGSAMISNVGIAKKACMFIDNAPILTIYNLGSIVEAYFDIKAIVTRGVLNPNSSGTVPIPTLPFTVYSTTVLGVYKTDRPGGIISPLTENEGDVIIDQDNKTITITNKTDKTIYFIIYYRLAYPTS
jgi:hypothetical protein